MLVYQIALSKQWSPAERDREVI